MYFEDKPGKIEILTTYSDLFVSKAENKISGH